MKILTECDILAVHGGVVDKSSEAYKIGQDVGEVIRIGGEVLGFVGGAIAVLRQI